jgi:hypothetical protein
MCCRLSVSTNSIYTEYTLDAIKVKDLAFSKITLYNKETVNIAIGNYNEKKNKVDFRRT